MSHCILCSTAVSTEDDNVYHIRPIRGDRKGEEVTLTFDVKCRNDAHVALLSSSSVDHPMIEVFIGGWRNQKSAIRFNQTKPDKAIVETPDIVSEEEYRRFWIRVNSCSVRVGCEGDTEPFLSWDEREDPFRVTHFGFATGWGSTGSWYLEEGTQSESYSTVLPFHIFTSRQRIRRRPHRHRRRRMKIRSRSVKVRCKPQHFCFFQKHLRNEDEW